MRFGSLLLSFGKAFACSIGIGNDPREAGKRQHDRCADWQCGHFFRSPFSVALSRREKAALDLALGLVGELPVLKVAGDIALDRTLARLINRIRQPAEKTGPLTLGFVRDEVARRDGVRDV